MWTKGKIYLVSFILIFSVLKADDKNNEIGGYPGAFLRIGVGARALSMGGAFTGIANDANATYWNAAGLAQINEFEASAMYSVLSLNRQFNSASVVFPSGGFGSIGFGWINLNVGNIIGRDTYGNVTNTFTNSENCLMISYGGSLNDMFFFGGATKYILHTLNNASATGYGFDVSLLMRLLNTFSFGCNFQNINSKLKWDTPSKIVEHLPVTKRLGIGLNNKKFPILLTCDWVATKEGKGIIHGGVEYNIKNSFFLRGGYYQKYFTAGFALSLPLSEYHFIELAYGYGQESIDLQPIHRLSISYKINKKYPESKSISLDDLWNETYGKQETNNKSILIKPEPIYNSDVDFNIPETRIRNPYAVAILIGISNYLDSTISPIKYAAHDADIMKKYLIHSLGYDSANVILCKNQQATIGAFDKIFGPRGQHKKLGLLANLIRPNLSDVFIYFSCHGAPDYNNMISDSAEVFLVPYDCDLNYLRESGYSVRELVEKLRLLKTKSTTLVFDACFSGRTKAGEPLRSDFRIAAIRHKKVSFNLGTAMGTVFTSSSLNQLSMEYPEKQHGLFTYYFLKGLQGEADKTFDGNSDGKITVKELAKYVRENVILQARRKNKDQVPQIWVTQKGAERVLVDLEERGSY